MVIRKSARELGFVIPREPLPSVEVQAESLEAQGLYLGRILEEVLSTYASEHPSSVATVYVSGTMSVNFVNEPGWSEFITVAGEKGTLQVLGGAFARLRHVRSRLSDHILPSRGSATYHIQEGRLWQAEDVLTWFSTDRDTAADGNGDGGGDLENDSDAAGIDLSGYSPDSDAVSGAAREPSSGNTEVVDNVHTEPRRSGRMNAARSDASVATIRGKIEELFGLPAGSVALCGPDGRPLRGDALIRTLRRRWDVN